MARTTVEFPDGIVETIEATRTRGTIVCSSGKSGQNGMTIGWINIGSVWGRPVCTVLIRESRHTHKIIESADSFTVSVLPEELQDAVDLFGSESGRDMDKFAAAKVTPEEGSVVASPYIAEADLVIECKIALSQPMDPNLIRAAFVKSAYPDGDYHTIYYGEIVAIHRK